MRPPAELSGILLESVEEILREPIAEKDLLQALDRARQLAQATIPDRSRPTRQLFSQNHTLIRIQAMILAHKGLSIAAATMVTALAAGLILYVSLFSPSTVAYALEQTAQANKHINSYHVKISPSLSLAGVGEVWVQLAPDGTPLHARIDFFGGDHGDRVGVVSRSAAEFWWKAKNIRVVSDNKYVVATVLNQCAKMRSLFDPKLAFEQLQADQAAGKVQIATKEPENEGEPITLTVSSQGDPGRRHVYEVDPKTKLVQRGIEYRKGGDQWKQVAKADYVEYNHAIDAKVFQPELPKRYDHDRRIEDGSWQNGLGPGDRDKVG